VPKLKKVLPAAKVARYMQIENKIRAALAPGFVDGHAHLLGFGLCAWTW